MPETMSPREKDVQERVEKIVFEKFYGGPLSGSKERLAAALIAEFNLAALASSGDHAELARLAEAATPGPWKACGTIYEHMNCEVRSGAKGEGQAIAQVWDGPNAFKDGLFIAAANPATVLALIAEVAPLRARNERLMREADETALVGYRAAEAERKLAEAVGLLEGWVDTTDQECVSGLFFDDIKDTRTFLSKEAERG